MTKKSPAPVLDATSTAWLAEIKDVLSQGRSVSARLSPTRLKAVRTARDLELVRQKAPGWSGECLTGPSAAVITRLVRKPELWEEEGVSELTLSAPLELTPAQELSRALALARSCSSPEELASRIELRELLALALDWHAPASSRVTAPVVRAFGAALTATATYEIDGATVKVSRFAQAIEMLGFAAALSPLLEPDRIARVVAIAASTPNAFAPPHDPVALSAHLVSTLSRYADAKREELLVSLWNSAHALRWWNQSEATPLDLLLPREPDAREPETRQDHYLVAQRESERELRAHQDALWDGETLSLPAEALTHKWWLENEGLLAGLVSRFHAPAWEALKLAATHLPNETQRAAADRALQEAARGRRDYSFAAVREAPLLALAQNGSIPAGGYYDLSPLLPVLTSEQRLALVGAAAGVGYSLSRTLRYWQQLGIHNLGSDIRAEIYAANPSRAWRTNCIQHGMCSSEQFEAFWARNGEKARLTILSSPLVEDTHRNEFLTGLLRNPETLVEARLSFVLASLDEVPESMRVSVFAALSPEGRADALALARPEDLISFLEIESDESVVSEALLRSICTHRSQVVPQVMSAWQTREALGNEGKPPASPLYRKRMRATRRELSRRISSWRSIRDVLEVITGEYNASFAGLDLEAISELIIKHRISGASLKTFIALGEARAQKFPVALFRHAAQTRSIPDGNLGVTAMIALGGAASLALDMARASDKDAQVAASYAPDLTPDLRPVSSIVEMCATMVEAEVAGADGKPRTWPLKPRSWNALYCAPPKSAFKTDPHVLDVFDGPCPGVASSTVSIIRDAVSLKENATYMGNCTYSYASRARSGQCAIGRVEVGSEVYNFEIARVGGYYQRSSSQGQWQLCEVNSRFNSHRVPSGVRAGLDQLVAVLNLRCKSTPTA